MTPDDDPITREEMTTTINNMVIVTYILEQAIRVMPDAERVWSVIRTYEELAHETGEYDRDIALHIRAGAEAIDALRSAHAELLHDVVIAAENILKEEAD